MEIWKYGNMDIWKYGNMEIRNNNVANVTESSKQLEIFKLCTDLKHGIWIIIELKKNCL